MIDDEEKVACDEISAPRLTFGLPRVERLRSKKEIGELFDAGRASSRKPLRVIYSEAEANAIMVSVPKRLFKRAVDRNLLKRRIREAYRLNRQMLGGKYFRIAILYTSGSIEPYAKIEASLRSILVSIHDSSKVVL